MDRSRLMIGAPSARSYLLRGCMLSPNNDRLFSSGSWVGPGPSFNAGGQPSASSSTNNGPLRGNPAYYVYGETCLLTMKLMPPAFKLLRNNAMVLDGNKKGRILFEWNPRAVDGSVVRDKHIRFGLSPEEVGLLIHQIPEHQVELSRGGPSEYGMAGPIDEEIAEKILRVTPGPGGVVSFKVDFEKNGVGSQPSGFRDDPAGPLEVVAQLGEYQVMREIMRSSMPVLAGWTTMMELALERSLFETKFGSGENRRSGPYDVPF